MSSCHEVEMAQGGFHFDRERFCCLICLDLLKDPMTIPCGHNYCMSCIRGFWNEEDQRRIYSCPQCGQTFRPRPVLVRNNMLADLVEELENTGPHANICSHHDEVVKMFCRTDQKCICHLCSVNEHKGHDTVSAAAERTERQKEHQVSRLKIQERIQHKERDVKVLQLEMEKTVQSAKKVVTECETMFTLLNVIKKQIRSLQETEVIRVKAIQEKLEEEISELRRKNAELEKLSMHQDDIQFLQNCPMSSKICESPEVPSMKIRPLRIFEDVTSAVSQARDKIVDLLSESITTAESKIDVSPSCTEPMSRADLILYSCEITLDPNTVNTQLSLSEMNRKATLMRDQQDYPSHPDRFIRWRQVLSRNSLCGQCYWEVEWRRKRVTVAVAYKDIKRAGSMTDVAFGFNNKSWALECNSSSTYKFIHNGVKKHISGPWSSRIGVFLDHRAGVLSFYSVSETMTLLHRVQTTFTQPLYAGLWFSGYNGATAEFCELK
ncbi:tripartite motif-containing protein 65-like [Sphaeramia orbicularis]|uniref:tripartite motif-containing protein 65-like n=1 Tax=Sphaeramia orbicularis TaxID=375764 RepID=UPI001180E1CD|nr:tripartite motif-containing protein 65-like [Sphaeramia orbicularis]